nr:hypothetical protein [uncultured Flavobacterium sp.]
MDTEKKIAQIAKGRLHQNTNNLIHSRLNKRSGETLSELKILTKFKKQHLTRLSVKGPKQLYVQNYGFEGVKSNGLNMRLKAKAVVDDAIEQANVIDFLAESLSVVRAEEVAALIR